MSTRKLPIGWVETTLAEIGKIVSGGTPSTSIPGYWSGEINWITPADLSKYNDKYISKGGKSLTSLGLSMSSAKLIPPGSLLFSSRAPIGYVAIAASELCTNQGFKNVVPYDFVSSEYLYYFLKTAKKQAEDLASGTTFKEISLKNFSKLVIPLPPLPEQQRIVAKIEELFSELDKAVEVLQAAQQQLKVYRQAVLKQAFEGRLTHPDLPEGELPEGWEVKTFGSCTTNFDGKRVPLSRQVRSERRGEYRYYGATEIVDYIDDYLFEGIYLLIGEDGANLLSKVKPLSHVVEGRFWVNNHAHVVQAIDGISINYLSFYFNSLHIDEYVTGTAQPKLTQANMNKIKIIIPRSYGEQEIIVNEINRQFSICDLLESNIKESLKYSDRLRNSILQKAFAGKLI